MVSVTNEMAIVVLVLVLALGVVLGFSLRVLRRHHRRGRYLRERGW